MTRTEVFLGLGSNLGDRAANIRSGLKALGGMGQTVRCSALYETPAQGFAGQPAYVNVACSMWTALDRFELLHRVIGAEADLGRRRAFPSAPRTLDIDILMYGSNVLSSPSLTLPHPEVARRAFVLAPLDDIAPWLVHPRTGETVQAMLRRLPAAQRQSVRRIGPVSP